MNRYKIGSKKQKEKEEMTASVAKLPRISQLFTRPTESSKLSECKETHKEKTPTVEETFNEEETFTKKETSTEVLLYSHLQHHNDTITKTDARRKTPKGSCRKTSLTIFYLSLYCKGSKGLFKGCMWEGAGDRI